MKLFTSSYFYPKKKIMIVQSSPMGTGSTILVNILNGFICSEKPIYYDYGFFDLLEKQQISLNNFKVFERDFLGNDVNIIKTHNLNIEFITNTFAKKYDVYFVCSERDKFKIDAKYYQFKNVIVFNYDDLLETNENTVENIINFVNSKLYNFLPKTIELNDKNAITRVKNMNSLYEFIKEKPFTFVDKFYQLHGSHRNRNLSP
jgi:hypothetical protein